MKISYTSTPRQMKFAGKRRRTEWQQNIAMTQTKYTPLNNNNTF